MTPIRFCMLTTFYPPHNFGGDGISIQWLSRALVARGHHVTVVCDVDAYEVLRQASAQDPEDDGRDGVEVVRLRSRWARLSTLLTQQTGRPVVNGLRIRNILDRGRYDVINFHNVSLIGGPDLLAYGGDAVKIYTAHEHWLVCPTHALWRHNREPCTGRQCLRCSMAYRRPPQLWRYTGRLDRRLGEVDAFIAMSEFSRNKHREFGFSRPMDVVPYFLPDAAVDGRSDGVSPQERPYFLFVGRLETLKGLDDVIPLFGDIPAADLTRCRRRSSFRGPSPRGSWHRQRAVPGPHGAGGAGALLSSRRRARGAFARLRDLRDRLDRGLSRGNAGDRPTTSGRFRRSSRAAAPGCRSRRSRSFARR